MPLFVYFDVCLPQETKKDPLKICEIPILKLFKSLGLTYMYGKSNFERSLI